LNRGDASAAVRIYTRLARATQDPTYLRRGAEGALSAGHHQHAADLARRALALREKDVELRVLLATIYVQAKMLSSATSEFERALELAPDDENVKDWLKRIKKGDV
jgi:Flp pilus assembly protein TadD